MYRIEGAFNIEDLQQQTDSLRINHRTNIE